jgi:hypothetical protein
MTIATSVIVILGFCAVLIVGALSVLQDLLTRGPYWAASPSEPGTERGSQPDESQIDASSLRRPDPRTA